MKVVAQSRFPRSNTYIPEPHQDLADGLLSDRTGEQMMKFTGENWQLFGPIIDGHAE